jgi:membrane protein YdbS with pleckstrin-like domain
MSPIVFPSRIDRWLAVVIATSALVSLGAALILPFTVSAALGITLAVLLLASAGIQLWLMRATDYTVDGTELRIRCGPFRWRIPLRDIHRVTPTRSPLSSPALSLDRLRIEYGDGRALMVSPADKVGFVAAVEQRTR